VFEIICLLFIDKVLFSFIQIQLSTNAALCVLRNYLYMCLIVTVFCMEFGLCIFSEALYHTLLLFFVMSTNCCGPAWYQCGISTYIAYIVLVPSD
jgi:hypothetical protein